MEHQSDSLDVVGQLEPLRRYALSLTRDPTEAEDLVQDTLLRAIERQAQHDRSASLRGWLMAILHNRFLDRARSLRTREAGQAEFGRSIEPFVAGSQEGHVRLADLRRAFAQLPDEQRAVLHLVCVEGLTYDKAAALLSIPVGTLVSRLSRARARLRELEEGRSDNVVRLRTRGGADAANQ